MGIDRNEQLLMFRGRSAVCGMSLPNEYGLANSIKEVSQVSGAVQRQELWSLASARAGGRNGVLVPGGRVWWGGFRQTIWARLGQTLLCRRPLLSPMLCCTRIASGWPSGWVAAAEPAQWDENANASARVWRHFMLEFPLFLTPSQGRGRGKFLWDTRQQAWWSHARGRAING